MQGFVKKKKEKKEEKKIHQCLLMCKRQRCFDKKTKQKRKISHLTLKEEGYVFLLIACLTYSPCSNTIHGNYLLLIWFICKIKIEFFFSVR